MFISFAGDFSASSLYMSNLFFIKSKQRATSGKLISYLVNIKEQAQEHFERIVEQKKSVRDYRVVKSGKSDRMGSENERYTGMYEED